MQNYDVNEALYLNCEFVVPVPGVQTNERANVAK